MDRRLEGEASELKLGERLDLEALRDRAQDRSDQRHPGEVEADSGSVHRKKGAVGRVAAPAPGLSPLPGLVPSSSPGSGHAWAYLTATLCLSHSLLSPLCPQLFSMSMTLFLPSK